MDLELERRKQSRIDLRFRQSRLNDPIVGVRHVASMLKIEPRCPVRKPGQVHIEMVPGSVISLFIPCPLFLRFNRHQWPYSWFQLLIPRRDTMVSKHLLDLQRPFYPGSPHAGFPGSIDIQLIVVQKKHRRRVTPKVLQHIFKR